jgi:hypothetical protein
MHSFFGKVNNLFYQLIVGPGTGMPTQALEILTDLISYYALGHKAITVIVTDPAIVFLVVAVINTRAVPVDIVAFAYEICNNTAS